MDSRYFRSRGFFWLDQVSQYCRGARNSEHPPASQHRGTVALNVDHFAVAGSDDKSARSTTLISPRLPSRGSNQHPIPTPFRYRPHAFDFVCIRTLDVFNVLALGYFGCGAGAPPDVPGGGTTLGSPVWGAGFWMPGSTSFGWMIPFDWLSSLLRFWAGGLASGIVFFGAGLGAWAMAEPATRAAPATAMQSRESMIRMALERVGARTVPWGAKGDRRRVFRLRFVDGRDTPGSQSGGGHDGKGALAAKSAVSDG